MLSKCFRYFFQTRARLDPYNPFICQHFTSHRDVYTHFSYAITESKLSIVEKWSRSTFSAEVTQRPTFSLLLNGICISRPRKSRQRRHMCIYVRRTYTRPHQRINKEVGIHGHARAHASSLAFLSTYLCHEYSRASRIGFSIFDVSLARTLERSSVKVDTEVIILSSLAGRAIHIPFLSVNRATEHVSPHFRQSVTNEADEERRDMYLNEIQRLSAKSILYAFYSVQCTTSGKMIDICYLVDNIQGFIHTSTLR